MTTKKKKATPKGRSAPEKRVQLVEVRNVPGREFLQNEFAVLSEQSGANYLRHLQLFMRDLEAHLDIAPILKAFDDRCQEEFETAHAADLAFVQRLKQVKDEFVAIARLPEEPPLPDNHVYHWGEYSLPAFDFLVKHAPSRPMPSEIVGQDAIKFLSSELAAILASFVQNERIGYETGTGRRVETPLYAELEPVAQRVQRLAEESQHTYRNHNDFLYTDPGPHLRGLRRLVRELNPPPTDGSSRVVFSADPGGVHLLGHFGACALYQDGKEDQHAQQSVAQVHAAVTSVVRGIQRQLRASQPGPVFGLPWEKLDGDRFEQLVYEILGTIEEYSNVQRLMPVNAPDGGRDISADRIVRDSVGNSTFEKVIVQCKRLGSALSPTDLMNAANDTLQWGRVDVLIVAAPGDFSQPAVRWAEERDRQRLYPRVFLWGSSLLEHLLASRGPLAGAFGLR